MSPRFRVVAEADLVEIRFDDGGMNLLSSDALAELSQVIDSLLPNVRALLFDSGRPGVFAAGADMQEMRAFSARDAEEFSRLGQELFGRIARLPLLTAAFIDGDCFGGALDLALAFDLRFATARSRFSHPGAKIGIVTGFGGTSRWRTQIPRASARRLFLDSAIVKAADARSIGIVDAVVEG
ncbi:MAG TPA: enoyl-CoA hydratase/isomerase family protein, partial [Thermoanaerobaculia bacterium]